MATKVVITMVCDRCGHEDVDTDQFRHVTVAAISTDTRANAKKPKIHSERDLCTSCVGMPGVNLEN
jgi:hypothetical protein